MDGWTERHYLHSTLIIWIELKTKLRTPFSIDNVWGLFTEVLFRDDNVLPTHDRRCLWFSVYSCVFARTRSEHYRASKWRHFLPVSPFGRCPNGILSYRIRKRLTHKSYNLLNWIFVATIRLASLLNVGREKVRCRHDHWSWRSRKAHFYIP